MKTQDFDRRQPPATGHAPNPKAIRVCKALMRACAALAVIVSLVGLGVVIYDRLTYDGEAAHVSARMASIVRFVRMPGDPRTCLAEFPAYRGYGPTFLGAAPCDAVRDRIVFDEGIGIDLSAYAVSRIPDTKACLAYDASTGKGFTFACGD